jgi:hypothetical protein
LGTGDVAVGAVGLAWLDCTALEDFRIVDFAPRLTNVVDTAVLTFWRQFEAYSTSLLSSPNTYKYLERNYVDYSSGYSNWHFSLAISVPKETLSCSVYIPNIHVLYRQFESSRAKLKEIINGDVEWHEETGKVARRIVALRGFNCHDEATWPQAFDWLLEQMIGFTSVLGPLSIEN